jgi:hypothetical protein
MKKVLALAALFLVVFSSGCTVPGLNIEIPFLPDIFGGMNVKEQTSDIISIDSLSAIPSATVRSGQSIHLRAVVKNLQKPEYKAVDGVVIGLYNDCGMFKVNGDLCSGSQPPALNRESGMFECTVKMYPQSTALVEWTLVANDINVETPCKIGVMAKYDYITYSTTSVTFINKAELERIVAEGKSFSQTGTASIGEGPVKPYIEVLSQPIVIDTQAGSNVKNIGSGIMTFWIENKGSGIIELLDSSKGNVVFYTGNPPSRESTYLGKIYIKLSSTATSVGEGIMAVNSQDLKYQIQECMKEHLKNGNIYSINFIGKSTPKYSCSITVNNAQSVKQESTYQIMAEVWYDYKFTKETTITVQPKIKL